MKRKCDKKEIIYLGRGLSFLGVLESIFNLKLTQDRLVAELDDILLVRMRETLKG